jgi:hypothetical protein
MLSNLNIFLRLPRSPILIAGLLYSCLFASAQISLVHVTPCGSTSPFPATTCSIPSTGSGNLLVVGWTSTTGTGASLLANVSDNVGNSYSEAGTARAVDANPTTNDMGDVWYAKNSLPGATVLTITPDPTGTAGTVVIWEFSGADTTAPLEQTAVLDSQAATATPSGASVTASSNELVISIANVQGRVTSIVPGNPFVSDSTVSGNGWAHLITSSAGSYSPQWNSTSGTYCSSTVSFVASLSGGGGGACDLNNDGVVNVADVQLATNMDLGLLSCPADLDGGVCGSALVQQIVNAALGLGCSATISYSVSLTWTASASPNIAGYNVYRSTTSGGPYTQLNSSLVTTFPFIDSTVTAGQIYYYVATAVDTSNNQSAYSSPPAPATIP